MSQGGWTNLSIRVENKQKLQELYKLDKQRPQNQSFNAYFENLIVEEIEHNIKLRNHGAFIEYKHAVDDHVLLFDNFIKKPIIMSIKVDEKKIYCEHDNSDNCIHVGYCFAIKKVYDILIDNGFRPPKNIDLS